MISSIKYLCSAINRHQEYRSIQNQEEHIWETCIPLQQLTPFFSFRHKTGRPDPWLELDFIYDYRTDRGVAFSVRLIETDSGDNAS
jgi:hypothetical protein